VFVQIPKVFVLLFLSEIANDLCVLLLIGIITMNNTYVEKLVFLVVKIFSEPVVNTVVEFPMEIRLLL